MVDFWCRKIGGGLYPDGDESHEVFENLREGARYFVDAKQPRNSGHHRLFWALCHRIANGLGRDDITSERVATEFKLATGHCETLMTKRHGEVKIPLSIAFAKMDQTEFDVFFEKCVRVAYEEWGIDPALVADLLVPGR